MPKTLLSFFDFNIKIATPNSTDFYLKKKNAHWYDSCHYTV